MNALLMLTSYSYGDGTVVGEDVFGSLRVMMTPIGNGIPHPHHSTGYAVKVTCADAELESYIFVPAAEIDNWEDSDFYSELCSVAEGKVYDTLGEMRGEAQPGFLYHYAPTLKTLFAIENGME